MNKKLDELYKEGKIHLSFVHLICKINGPCVSMIQLCIYRQETENILRLVKSKKYWKAQRIIIGRGGGNFQGGFFRGGNFPRGELSGGGNFGGEISRWKLS